MCLSLRAMLDQWIGRRCAVSRSSCFAIRSGFEAPRIGTVRNCARHRTRVQAPRPNDNGAPHRQGAARPLDAGGLGAAIPGGKRTGGACRMPCPRTRAVRRRGRATYRCGSSAIVPRKRLPGSGGREACLGLCARRLLAHGSMWRAPDGWRVARLARPEQKIAVIGDARRPGKAAAAIRDADEAAYFPTRPRG